MKLTIAVFFAAFVTGAAAMPFKGATVIDSVTSPRDWLVVADLNHDTRPDILCAAPGNNLRWWRNDGAGVFTQQPDIPLAGGTPVAVLARNLDRDDDTDLIVLIDPGNAAGRLHILKNNGSAVFAKTSEITLSGKLIPGSLPLAGDFDSDGDIDIMQAHQDAAQSAGNDPLSLALNDGAGTFAAPVTVTSALNWPTALAWHDCDENNVPDLVVGTSGATQLRVYRDYHPGGGLLLADLVSSPVAGIQEICGRGRGHVMIRYDGPGSGADSGLQSRLSFEGLLDWATHMADPNAKTVTCMEITPMYEYGAQAMIYIRRDPITQERLLYCGRFDRDLTSVLLGSTTARAVRCADMDGDGDSDIVLLRDGDIALHWNDSIRPATALTAENATLTLSHPAVDVLEAADVLPASGEEVLGALTAEGSIRVFAFEALQLQPGTILTTAAPGITALKTADLDNDGDIDVIFNAPGDDRVKWLRNNGNGTFSSPVTILVRPDPGPIDVGDIDRDGDIDVAMTFADGAVIIAMNDGAASPGWTMENGGTSGLLALEVKIADITPGLRQEILVQTFAFGSPAVASTLRIHRHLIFPSPGWYSSTLATGSSSVRGIAVADVEPDGDLDVIAGPGNTPSLYLNEGNGTLGTPVASGQADFTGTRRLRMADFENNGKKEVFSVNAGSLLATTVSGTGFGTRLNVTADFTGMQLRDVVPVSIHGRDDFLVVSDSATPALRLVRNNLRQIQHTVTPVSAPPDYRGGRSTVFSATLTNPAPAGGPDIGLYSLEFIVKSGGVAMPMAKFPQLVDKVELWSDAGTPGVLDAADVLLNSQTAGLNGDGYLVVNLQPAILQPLQTGRWLVAFRFMSAVAPGSNEFTVSWGGGALTAYSLSTLGHGEVLVAMTPAVTRAVQLTNLNALQQWRVTWWGDAGNAGPGGDNADPDSDGTSNLIEYTLGTSPVEASPSALTPLIDSFGRRAVSTAFSDPPRPDVTLTLEASPSMKPGTWTLFASRTGNGAWSGTALVTPGPSAGGRQTFTFAEPLPGSGAARFVRLKVQY